MIFEVLPTAFDIKKLQEHLKNVVIPLPPVMLDASFGGWSVLSSTGHYKDGWHKGHLVAENNQNLEEFRQKLTDIGAQPVAEYNKPTEVCVGYLKEVMDHITQLGLEPKRARIIKLSKGLSCPWHRDTPDHIYAARLHIPIVTNSECFFETETERDHMPANGNCYFARVNRIHRVVNGGDQNRYHVVMDITDRTGVSKYHRHDQNSSNV